eukprot:jgi/Bigna1/74130/fgenesh1_pg.27_\
MADQECPNCLAVGSFKEDDGVFTCRRCKHQLEAINQHEEFDMAYAGLTTKRQKKDNALATLAKRKSEQDEEWQVNGKRTQLLLQTLKSAVLVFANSLIQRLRCTNEGGNSSSTVVERQEFCLLQDVVHVASTSVAIWITFYQKRLGNKVSGGDGDGDDVRLSLLTALSSSNFRPLPISWQDAKNIRFSCSKIPFVVEARGKRKRKEKKTQEQQEEQDHGGGKKDGQHQQQQEKEAAATAKAVDARGVPIMTDTSFSVVPKLHYAHTLAAVYLSCRIWRVAVTQADIWRMTCEGKIPYFNIMPKLDPSTREALHQSKLDRIFSFVHEMPTFQRFSTMIVGEIATVALRIRRSILNRTAERNKRKRAGQRKNGRRKKRRQGGGREEDYHRDHDKGIGIQLQQQSNDDDDNNGDDDEDDHIEEKEIDVVSYLVAALSLERYTKDRDGNENRSTKDDDRQQNQEKLEQSLFLSWMERLEASERSGDQSLLSTTTSPFKSTSSGDRSTDYYEHHTQVIIRGKSSDSNIRLQLRVNGEAAWKIREIYCMHLYGMRRKWPHFRRKSTMTPFEVSNFSAAEKNRYLQYAKARFQDLPNEVYKGSGMK